MDIKQLNYLVAIVEYGGFSQASRQLNLAQPALSQQIARLEQEIGATLFHRSSKGATTTAKGLTLYRQAKFIVRQMDQAISLTRETDTGSSGVVAVGLPPSTSAQIGAELVYRLHHKYPGIVCNIVEGLSGDLRNLVAINELDLAILFSSTDLPGWGSTPLICEELFLVYPKDRLFFSPKTRAISIRDLSNVPLVLPSKRHGLRRRIDMEFERLNLICSPVAEIDSLSVLMQCLKRGLGATIKPLAAVNFAGADFAGQWASLPFSGSSLNRINHLCSLPEEKISPAARLVRQEIFDVVREMVLSKQWKGVTLIESMKTVHAASASDQNGSQHRVHGTNTAQLCGKV